VLKAVGKREGQVVVTKEVRSTGAPAAVQLSLDQEVLSADGRDVAHLQIEIIDSDGNVVPTADNLLHFDIEGEGRIIAVGNGNPMDHNPHKALQRNAFNGLCLAIIQSTRTAGKIHVKVNSHKLKGGEIEIITRKPQDAQAVIE
jgi:beta-galactosidase